VASPDAIAYFGETLVKLLQDGLGDALGQPKISMTTLSDLKNSPPSEPSVTVFLYNVGMSGDIRNVPQRATVDTRTNPLELHFLITPWLPMTSDIYAATGSIIALLFARPVLTAADLLGPKGTWEPDEAVEIILKSLPIEDQSYIWNSAGIPYRLSLSYVARGIRLQTWEGSGPVGGRNQLIQTRARTASG